MYQEDINGRIQLGEKKNRRKRNSDGRNVNESKDGNQDRETRNKRNGRNNGISGKIGGGEVKNNKGIRKGKSE